MARLCPARPILCVADIQTKGRGRGDKVWTAVPGATLCFSLCVGVHKPLRALGGITLAFGVALCQTLEGLGAKGLGLKWPNDIYAPAGKLAGMLTETHSNADDHTYLVVGVGLNIEPAPPWADMRGCLPTGSVLPRDEVLTRLVQGLLDASALYEREGFAPFHALYDARDCLKGQTIMTHGVEATVLGVSETGALLIDREPYQLR